MADSNDTTTPGKSPAFQFYPKDFITDENVAVMSMQERGLYITLICKCWIQGTLPSDPERLSKVAGLPVAQFRKAWPAVSACFRNVGDRLVHPRLEKELAKQLEYRRRQSDKGRASAEKRRELQPEVNHGSTTVQPDIGKQPQPKPNSSSSSSSSSPDFSPHASRVSHARMGGGVMAGSLPREHLRHSWCGRVCVPDFLHAQFEQATGQPEKALKEFYTQTFERIADTEPVDPDSVKFWRPRVAAKWPAKQQPSGPTAVDVVALMREKQAQR